MLVEEEIVGNVYINLMNYIFKKCDSISLTKRHDQHEEITSRYINIMSSISGYSIDDFIDKYSDKFLNEIYEIFKDNEEIFDTEYMAKYENGHPDYFKRWISITQSVEHIYHNNVVEKWKIKNESNIDKIKMVIHKYDFGDICRYDTYYLKINTETKKEVLSKKSLYDWCFPNSIEDICFFKDGYCFLETVAHEELCFIYCENKEEYEYLKSIGIKFFDKEFKPTKMGKWEYGDHNKN